MATRDEKEVQGYSISDMKGSTKTIADHPVPKKHTADSASDSVADADFNAPSKTDCPNG